MLGVICPGKSFDQGTTHHDSVRIFGHGHGPLNDLLTEFVGTLDPAMLEIIEEPARNVWGYSDIYPLLGDMSASFDDEFACVLRDNDYLADATKYAPPHDDAVVAAWTIVLTVDDHCADRVVIAGDTLEVDL